MKIPPHSSETKGKDRGHQSIFNRPGKYEPVVSTVKILGDRISDHARLRGIDVWPRLKASQAPMPTLVAPLHYNM